MTTSSTYMYHITNYERVPAILIEGLRTNADGWDAGFVWLFDDLGLALEALPKFQRGRAVILEVDISGLATIPDPHPGWGTHWDDHAFAVPCAIAADRVRLLV